MTEPAVDVNSRTSLARQWWKLQKEDFTKKGVVATTVLNWAFAGLSIWMYIGPHFESRGAENSQATLSQLQKDKLAAESDAKHWGDVATRNQLANDELMKQKADQAAKVAELEQKLQAALGGEGPKEPAKQEASSVPQQPKIKRVKTKAIQAPKEEPSTCSQIEACKAFVAWYEQNVGTGAN